MTKFKHASTVQGTPVRSIGPNGGGPSANNGFRGGTDGGHTVQPQYRGSGIPTAPAADGTPESYKTGNPDNNAKRVASRGRSGGVVLSENGVNHNNPRASGGVIFDGTHRVAEGHQPYPAPPSPDSPVPKNAPRFDPSFIDVDARARLGGGNESGASESLVKSTGVMGRE